MKLLCVQEEELTDFVQGRLPAERLEAVAAHIDDCSDCQDTVASLAEQSDTFIDELRDPKAEHDASFEHEPALQKLLGTFSSSELPQRKSNADSSDQPQNANRIHQVGPYILEEPLGAGGMGTVYRAFHSRLKRRVAVKVLPQHRWANAVAVSRFEREMEAIGSLDHENIVGASDAGSDNGLHFLVMEYVDGLDLSRISRRLGPLPVATVCEIGRQAALGLQHAHENGLIHRDVKPSNVMLAQPTRRGGNTPTVKLLDLGLALLGDEHLVDGDDLTTVGQLMGTLDYMSPEQGGDSHSVDHRTDIYGLGATLFRLLTGRAPYATEEHNTLMKKMTALATKRVTPICEVRHDVPADVAKIIDTMLDRDPNNRQASATEVASQLADHCEGANLTSFLNDAINAPDPPRRAVANAKRPMGMPMPHEAGTTNYRAPRWLVALAAAFFLGVAAMAFRFATDFGEVVITSDDPNAKIELIREDETFQTLQLTKEGENKFRVRAGEYSVVVSGTDNVQVSVTPATLEVERGKNSPLTVTSGDRIPHKNPTSGLATVVPEPLAALRQSETNANYVPYETTNSTQQTPWRPLIDQGNASVVNPLASERRSTPPYQNTVNPLRLEKIDLLKQRVLAVESELRAVKARSKDEMLGLNPTYQKLEEEKFGLKRVLSDEAAASHSLTAAEKQLNIVHTVMDEMGVAWEIRNELLIERLEKQLAKYQAEFDDVTKPNIDVSDSDVLQQEPESQPANVTEAQSEAMYANRTYSAWFYLLERERQLSTLTSAAEAMRVLHENRDDAAVAAALLRTMRIYGKRSYSPSQNPTLHNFAESVTKTLMSLTPYQVVESIIVENQEGNDKSRDFLKEFIRDIDWNNHAELRSAIDDRIDEFVGIWMLSSDDDEYFIAHLVDRYDVNPKRVSSLKEYLADAMKNYEVNGTRMSNRVLPLAVAKIAPDTPGLIEAARPWLNQVGGNYGDPGPMNSQLSLLIKRLGPHAAPVVPTLLESLQKTYEAKNEYARIVARVPIVMMLGSIGPKAQDALQPLRDLQVVSSRSSDRGETLKKLKREIKKAIEAIEKAE